VEHGADVSRIQDDRAQHVNSLVQLASLELRADGFEAGIDAADRAVSLAPGQPVLHLLQGSLLTRLRERAQALVAFDRGLKIAPENPWLLYNKMECLYDLGRIDEAKALLTLLRARELPRRVAEQLERVDPELW